MIERGDVRAERALLFFLNLNNASFLYKITPRIIGFMMESRRRWRASHLTRSHEAPGSPIKGGEGSDRKRR